MAQMKVLVKNATIIAPGQKLNNSKLNILINEGKITYLGTDTPEATNIIEAEDLMVSVGWMDMRSFSGEPGYEHREDIESLCAAATDGGFTGVAVLPNTQPTAHTKNTVAFIKNKTSNLITQAYPIASVTVNAKGEQLSEMIDLHHAGAVAFSDGINPIWQSDILLKTLQYLQKFDGLLINRPEDLQLTKFGTMHEGIYSTMLGLKGMPSLAEEMMVARDLRLLEYAGGKLHFSLISTAGSIQLIREAKQKGLKVSCDIAAHQMAFTEADLMGFDTNLKVNPPFRSETDIEAIKTGLADGTIDAIVSDHWPHDPESKQLEFDLADFGVLGLQTAFAVANTYAGLTATQLVDKFAIAPRRLLNLPEPGIEVGQVAELTIFSTSHSWTFSDGNNLSRSANSPFLGKELRGRALAVFNNSRMHIQKGFLKESSNR
jgi:dihydroorotase